MTVKGDICCYCNNEVSIHGWNIGVNNNIKTYECCEFKPKPCKYTQHTPEYNSKHKDCMGCPDWCVSNRGESDLGNDECGHICVHCGDMYVSNQYRKGNDIKHKLSFGNHRYCMSCGEQEDGYSGYLEKIDFGGSVKAFICQECHYAYTEYEQIDARRILKEESK